jgi:hypothetical protein
MMATLRLAQSSLPCPALPVKNELKLRPSRACIRAGTTIPPHKARASPEAHTLIYLWLGWRSLDTDAGTRSC